MKFIPLALCVFLVACNRLPTEAEWDEAQQKCASKALDIEVREHWDGTSYNLRCSNDTSVNYIRLK